MSMVAVKHRFGYLLHIVEGKRKWQKTGQEIKNQYM